MTVVQFPSNNVAVKAAFEKWGDKLDLNAVETDDGLLSIAVTDKLGRVYALLPKHQGQEWALFNDELKPLGSFTTPSEALAFLAS